MSFAVAAKDDDMERTVPDVIEGTLIYSEDDAVTLSFNSIGTILAVGCRNGRIVM